MNLEREAMQGRLAGLKQQREKLRLRIDGNARQIRQGLITALIPVDDLEVLLLDEQWDELKTAWAELTKVNADIARLERELH